MLEISQLHFHYANDASGERNRYQLLSNLNLTISEGEFVAITGPSGSGKSTLLYLLSGFLRPTSGFISYHGRRLDHMSDLELAFFRNRWLGFVFQQFYLLPKNTALENVYLPLSYPQEIPNLPAGRGAQASYRAQELLKKLNITNFHHYPNQLSGGEQQRVAIARALICSAPIIIADEPTGNLDSANGQVIFRILQQLHQEGKTIIMVTHDLELAQGAQRIVRFQDGKISQDFCPWPQSHQRPLPADSAPVAPLFPRSSSPFLPFWPLLKLASKNIFRHRLRSFLTMLGISVGVAAVLAMLTLGTFTKEKILASYAELGVDTFTFSGRFNWARKASEKYDNYYRGFNLETDILPLQRIFPSILHTTPIIYDWDLKLFFGGRIMENNITLLGVNSAGTHLLNRKLELGNNFTPFHVQDRNPVCLIGKDIQKTLFSKINPIGQILLIQSRSRIFPCKILGVLAPKSSRHYWLHLDREIYVPYTYLRSNATSRWQRRIDDLAIQVAPGIDPGEVGPALANYFQRKYGNTGLFNPGFDTQLIAQMQRFLGLFTILLATIALVCLGVGGVGIANMMLVAVNERHKEIGIRKALGATDRSIVWQFLTEAMVLCCWAGIGGMLLGFSSYQLAIYFASRFIKGLEFSWYFYPPAFAFAGISIIAVGIASGIFPALSAQKRSILAAIRAD